MEPEKQTDGAAAPQPSWPMLLTRHFAFVHVPKTGGTFLRKLCFERLPKDWLIENSLHPHTRYDQIKDGYPHLPVFALVRNPWDWYVSWYHFMTQIERQERRSEMWRTTFRRGDASFREVIESACTGRGFVNPTSKPIMDRLGVDHYTAIHLAHVGSGVDDGRLEVGRSESLREDFLAFLDRHEVPIDGAFRSAARAEPAYGASDRTAYRDYYDEKLRDLVAANNWLIGEYGYSF
jgi:hypothetical protein